MSKKGNENFGKEFVEICSEMDAAEKQSHSLMPTKASVSVKRASELFKKYGKSLSADEREILEKGIRELGEKCKKESNDSIYSGVVRLIESAGNCIEQYQVMLELEDPDYTLAIEIAERPILYALDDLSLAISKIREFEPFCDREMIEDCRHEISMYQKECYNYHACLLMEKALISASRGSLRETRRNLRDAAFRYGQTISLGPAIYSISKDDIDHIIESACENYSGSRAVSFLASGAMKAYFHFKLPKASKKSTDELLVI